MVHQKGDLCAVGQVEKYDSVEHIWCGLYMCNKRVFILLNFTVQTSWHSCMNEHMLMKVAQIIFV